MKMYQFTAKVSEIKPCPLCLGNISKDFTLDNMKKRAKRSCKTFSVDYNAIDTSHISDNHTYLMKETLNKMFWIY